MNRTKIETFDYTWNPVTGCLKGCDYCYATGIAHRFNNKATVVENLGKFYGGHIAHVGDSFPYGFQPTFYPHRLSEPYLVKKPSKVFVCSMADLFGDWVPRGWIEQVIDAMKAAPQHTFFLLTKNPGRFQKFTWPDNCWLGTTVTKFEDFYRNRILNKIPHNTWYSIEPILGPIITEDFWIDGEYLDAWLVLGAMTGQLAKEHPVQLEWIKSFVSQAKQMLFPVYMKDSLSDIWPGKLIKQLPGRKLSKKEGE